MDSMNAKIEQAIALVQREVKVGYINQLTSDPVEFFHASTRISQQGVRPERQLSSATTIIIIQINNQNPESYSTVVVFFNLFPYQYSCIARYMSL